MSDHLFLLFVEVTAFCHYFEMTFHIYFRLLSGLLIVKLQILFFFLVHLLTDSYIKTILHKILLFMYFSTFNLEPFIGVAYNVVGLLLRENFKQSWGNVLMAFRKEKIISIWRLFSSLWFLFIFWHFFKVFLVMRQYNCGIFIFRKKKFPLTYSLQCFGVVVF